MDLENQTFKDSKELQQKIFSCDFHSLCNEKSKFRMIAIRPNGDGLQLGTAISADSMKEMFKLFRLSRGGAAFLYVAAESNEITVGAQLEGTNWRIIIPKEGKSFFSLFQSFNEKELSSPGEVVKSYRELANGFFNKSA